ncbi:MAG: tRNA preQ1(34) S-adenosylmethionine ribosyltransferase-isomerase QueA [Acidobacteriota bacterium]|jgi:S-adenosylmethionine:tRNA ribosyltransferase-isomerase
MKLSDFKYHLPKRLIAQYPVSPRDASRLLVLGNNGTCLHSRFRNLSTHLEPGDLLVVNDTRVIKARLTGRRKTGGRAEVFLLRPLENGLWEAMVKPGRKLAAGEAVFLDSGSAMVEIESDLGEGRRAVSLAGGEFSDLVGRYGSVPLPPYIDRPAEARDTRRYQTLYAHDGRSVAAPTAGLHFTNRVLKSLAERGVETCRIRLDVGAGTFKPVTTENVDDHRMDFEPYYISGRSACLLNEALTAGRRIVAVGTTVTRTLEDQMARFGVIRQGEWKTDLFIRPGFRFRAISGLITNFHLPGSTLIMLVSALAGRERVMAAYRTAVDEEYRFYSYGDAMLVWTPSTPAAG